MPAFRLATMSTNITLRNGYRPNKDTQTAREWEQERGGRRKRVRDKSGKLRRDRDEGDSSKEEKKEEERGLLRKRDEMRDG